MVNHILFLRNYQVRQIQYVTLSHTSTKRSLKTFLLFVNVCKRLWTLNEHDMKRMNGWVPPWFSALLKNLLVFMTVFTSVRWRWPLPSFPCRGHGRFPSIPSRLHQPGSSSWQDRWTHPKEYIRYLQQETNRVNKRTEWYRRHKWRQRPTDPMGIRAMPWSPSPKEAHQTSKKTTLINKNM